MLPIFLVISSVILECSHKGFVYQTRRVSAGVLTRLYRFGTNNLPDDLVITDHSLNNLPYTVHSYLAKVKLISCGYPKVFFFFFGVMGIFDESITQKIIQAGDSPKIDIL
jgi:hypothetical protein